MLAPLGFSCPRCLLLRRGAGRWAFASLARQLAGGNSLGKCTPGKNSPGKDTPGKCTPGKDTPPKDAAAKDTTSKSSTSRTTAKDNSPKSKKRIEDIEIPPEPTTCCMSGCANCVWLDYAQTLAKLLGDNDEQAREIVLSKITDPNLKMFLMLELRNLKQKREEEAKKAGRSPPSK